MPQVGIGFLARYRRHLFPAAHARPHRALPRLDRAPHRPGRSLPPPSRQPLHPVRPFPRDQGCARRQPSDRPAARRASSRPGRGRTRGAYAAHRPRLFRAVGRSDSRTARSRARRRPSLRAGDRGRDPQEIADLAQTRLRPVASAARRSTSPRRSSSNFAWPPISSAAPIIARASPRASPARAARPAGSRQRSTRSTIRPSSACSPLRPRTSLSSKTLLRVCRVAENQQDHRNLILEFHAILSVSLKQILGCFAYSHRQVGD